MRPLPSRGRGTFGRRSVLAACAALGHRPALAQCGFSSDPAIPLRVIDGFPVIAATIDGVPVTFVLDTGAQAHLILPEAQATLRLPLLPGTVPVIGTGGATEAPIVRLDAVRLGAAVLEATAAPVTPLPALPHVSPMLAGLLGAPLLYQFDVGLDATAGRLALIDPRNCPRPDLALSLTSVPLSLTPDHRALLPVRIDGQTLTALLDTGSRATLLTAAAAARLDLRALPSANTAPGVDGERVPVSHVRVREIAVGADIRRNAPVSIAQLQLDGADMLLGFDYLRQRRVWISYVTGRLVIALPGPAPSAPRSPPPPPPGPARR